VKRGEGGHYNFSKGKSNSQIARPK
jgi:hypothetical protein